MVQKRVLAGRPCAPATQGSAPNANVYAEACPSRAILELIADKWTLLILPALRKGPLRNGELMRLIGGVSQKMLTQTLRELERNGLVVRIDHFEVPPRVEYDLTGLGRSLADAMRKLDSWVEINMTAVEAARGEFAKRERVTSR
jgi:DNA-binding HxlR family transcriptional regulator